MPFFEQITVDYEPGTIQEVTMHDGSRLFLKKLEEDYDATDKISALKRLHEVSRRGEFATGLIYIEPDREGFLTQLNLVDEPLASLPLARVRPGREALEGNHGRAQVIADCRLQIADLLAVGTCGLR